MLLRVGVGTPIDDIVEEFEENPAEFIARYFTRLPILGRYAGFLGEAISALFLMGGRGGSFGEMVPLGAFASLVNGLRRGIVSQVEGSEDKWQQTINMMRFMPYIGDRLLHIPMYLIADSTSTWFIRNTLDICGPKLFAETAVPTSKVFPSNRPCNPEAIRTLFRARS